MSKLITSPPFLVAVLHSLWDPSFPTRERSRPSAVKPEFQPLDCQGIPWKWKSLSRIQLFATPMDYTVCGILQARILEWVAYHFSSRSSQPRNWTQVSYSLLHCQVGSLSLGPPGKPHNEYYSELIRKEILTPAAKPWRHCTKLNKPAIKGKTLWKWKCLSRVWLFATPSWSIQSMEFPRPEYWSG